MEMIIVAIVCFAIGAWYNSGSKGKMDTQIMSFLKAGKRVIVCVDNDATIFELSGNKIRVTKAETNFTMMEDPIDLPRGVGNELESNSVASVGSDQSGNYNEAGLGD